MYKVNTSFMSSIKVQSKALDKLIANPMPVIWDMCGMVRVIPLEVVKNAVSQFTDWKKVTDISSIEFAWSEAEPVEELFT